jgi:hypothetical protein
LGNWVATSLVQPLLQLFDGHEIHDDALASSFIIHHSFIHASPRRFLLLLLQPALQFLNGLDHLFLILRMMRTKN